MEQLYMKNGKWRISWDIGGVLSKYPDLFRTMAKALANDPNIEQFILTDMHIHEQSVLFCHNNGFDFIPEDHIINSDFAAYGEACKSKTIEELGIDLHIDDFPGYCAHTKCISLFVWPNTEEPYYADEWWTDGSEGNFGRRKTIEGLRS